MSSAPQVEKLLYGRKDVAYALSLSLRTVDSMIANQVIVTRRFGGRVMIPAAEVRRIANQVARCDMLQGSAPAKPRALKIVPPQKGTAEASAS